MHLLPSHSPLWLPSSMLTKLFPDRGSYTLSSPPTPHTSAQTYDVLNELVLDRGPNAFLTNIEVWEKGRFITRVQADGIMLSTPTGGERGVWEKRHCCITRKVQAGRRASTPFGGRGPRGGRRPSDGVIISPGTWRVFRLCREKRKCERGPLMAL